MKRILLSIAATAVVLGTPASAKAQALEGKWTNPKRSVVVNVARCGEAYCGTVSWASDKNKAKGAEDHAVGAGHAEGRGAADAQRADGLGEGVDVPAVDGLDAQCVLAALARRPPAQAAQAAAHGAQRGPQDLTAVQIRDDHSSKSGDQQ